jgi:hypothetical protein
MKRWSQYDNSNMALIEYSLTYKPANVVSISLTPGYYASEENLQYVTTESENESDNYIMGYLNSKQFSLSARINIGITPDMSLQYYGQPFYFAGDYSNFKTITDADAPEYYDRFHEYDENEIKYMSETSEYKVDMDGNGTDFSFDDPDFHFLQYRSNLVFRWEYKPGSTFYLVWSQGKTTDGSEGEFMFSDYTKELRNAPAQNDFLIKVSYAIIF